MTAWDWLDRHPVLGAFALLCVCMTVCSVANSFVRARAVTTIARIRAARRAAGGA